jgi:hypothetical protein
MISKTMMMNPPMNTNAAAAALFMARAYLTPRLGVKDRSAQARN